MRGLRELPLRLPLEGVAAGTQWMRIHSRAKTPLWFGPAPGMPPLNRFDDPRSEYRVCYLGTTLEACFAETFLRNPPVRILSLMDLAQRHIASIELRRKVRLVALHGAGLARAGVTSEISSQKSYEESRQLGRRLWSHADRPDGIAYRSRHDDSALCIAVFDRAEDALGCIGQRELTGNRKALAVLLNRYHLGLTK